MSIRVQQSNKIVKLSKDYVERNGIFIISSRPISQHYALTSLEYETKTRLEMRNVIQMHDYGSYKFRMLGKQYYRFSSNCSYVPFYREKLFLKYFPSYCEMSSLPYDYQT